MMDGFSARITSGPRPSRSTAPGAKFSIITSACFAIALTSHEGPASNWVRSRTFMPVRQFSPLMVGRSSGRCGGGWYRRWWLRGGLAVKRRDALQAAAPRGDDPPVVLDILFEDEVLIFINK